MCSRPRRKPSKQEGVRDMANQNEAMQDAQRASQPATGGYAFTGTADATAADWGNSYGRGVYIGTAGDLKVDMMNGTTVTFVGMLAGTVYPIVFKKIYDTGTTAA